MKTVLILMGNESSANGICISRIVKVLSADGYRVLCVAMDGEGSPVIYGAEIVRVKPPLSAKISAWRGKHPGKAAGILFKLLLMIKKVKLLFLRPTWPLIYPVFMRRYHKAAEALFKKHDIDCVFSVFTPFEALWTGHQLKKKHPGAKFIAYFLDSLSGGVVPRFFSKESTRKRGLKWERKLLANADRIVYIKASRVHHERHSAGEVYYDRMTMLGVPALAVPDLAEKQGGEAHALLDGRKLNLVYTGSIALHIRDPEYFFRIFSRLRDPDIRLTLAVPHLYRLPAPYSDDPRITVKNSLPHGQVMALLGQANILVNFGNKLPSMVPSKLFEYMAAGGPIVSTCPIENEPCIPYLTQYPLHLLLREHIPDIERDAAALKKFIHASKGRSVAFDTMRERMFENTPEALVKLIGEVIGYSHSM